MSFLSIVCPECQAKYRVPAEKAGRKLRCKNCQGIIAVRAPEEEELEELPLANEAETLPIAKPKKARRAEEDRPRKKKRKSRDYEGGMRPLIRYAWVVLMILPIVGGIMKLVEKRPQPPTTGGAPSQTNNSPVASGPGLTPAPVAQSPLPPPPLPAGQRIQAGVMLHEVFLRPGDPDAKLWIYLPEQMPATKLPCVLIGPAGSTLFVGMDLGDGDRAEHVPYVLAGFAVVAHAIAGPCDMNGASDAKILAAYNAFRNSGAGRVNAKQALDYALAKVDKIDPQRIFTAGHSSAAVLALLVAEHDPRIAGCVAYAPAADVVKFLAPAMQVLGRAIPGFKEFATESSPLTHASKLRCPVFLFHARDDNVVPFGDTSRFAEEVKKTNPNVTLTIATSGGHHESMIREGIPAAIRWMQGVGKGG